MSDFNDSLDNALLVEKIDNLDPEFTMESIKNQLKNPLDNGIKRNFLKRMEDHYSAIIEEGGHDPDLDMQRDSLHLDMIHKIEDAYNITIDIEYVSIPKLVKHLYRFFILDIIDNIQQFIEMYIIEHKTEIANMIEHNTNNITYSSMKTSFDDQDIMVIASNISEAVSIISELPISFEEMIDTLSDHPDSSSSVDKIIKYYDDCINEEEDLYKTIMEPITKEKDGYTRILNNIQMSLCKKFAKDFE